MWHGRRFSFEKNKLNHDLQITKRVKAHYVGAVLSKKMYFLRYILVYSGGSFSLIIFSVLINILYGF
jgi:hypothetical protein